MRETWTKSALECYSLNNNCKECSIFKLIGYRCKMYETVDKLIEKIGPPKEEGPYFFLGLTEAENNIIKAILNGAKTFDEIAKMTTNTRTSAINYVDRVIRVAQENGAKFVKERDRLPELIEFIKEKSKKDEQMKDITKFHDKDLNIEYQKFYAPMIDAIKKGYRNYANIEAESGIKRGTLSVYFDHFYKHLAKLGLQPNETQKTKRDAVIDFIEDRLFKENKTYNKPDAPILKNPESKLLKEVQQEKIKQSIKEDLKKLSPLTLREEETKQLLLKGLNQNQIAEKLCISLATVKTHIGAIYQKGDYHSMQDLLVSELKHKEFEIENKNNSLIILESKKNELEAQNKTLKENIEDLKKHTGCQELKALKSKLIIQIDTLNKKLKAIEKIEDEIRTIGEF